MTLNGKLFFLQWSDPVPAATTNTQSNSDPFFSSNGTSQQPSNDLFANQAPTATTESTPAASTAPVKSTKGLNIIVFLIVLNRFCSL